MRNLIAITQVSVDGVMQAPGGPEEDPSNGFTDGGWAMPYGDSTLSKIIDETIAGEFDLLLGRRTYEIFAGYWPHQTGTIAAAFNKATKYVAARTLDSLGWKNSRPICKRLFERGAPPRGLSLIATRSTSKGVLLNTYRPAGPLPNG